MEGNLVFVDTYLCRKVEEYMGDGVTHIVTEQPWNQELEEASETNASIVVKPSWILQCNESKKLVAIQKHIVV